MLCCSKCCETKQPHELSARSRSKHGRQYVRRTCMSTYQAERKACKSTVGAEQPAERPAEQLYLLRYPWQDSPIKVGRTHDVAARICQLESGHNFRLQLLVVFPGLGQFEHKARVVVKLPSNRWARPRMVSSDLGAGRAGRGPGSTRSFWAARRSCAIEIPPRMPLSEVSFDNWHIGEVLTRPRGQHARRSATMVSL